VAAFAISAFNYKIQSVIFGPFLDSNSNMISVGSVAEPEPVEQQLFAGAGAKVFWPGFGSGAGYVNSYKMLQKP
jgi:hypothetical protein